MSDTVNPLFADNGDWNYTRFPAYPGGPLIPIIVGTQDGPDLPGNESVGTGNGSLLFDGESKRVKCWTVYNGSAPNGGSGRVDLCDATDAVRASWWICAPQNGKIDAIAAAQDGPNLQGIGGAHAGAGELRHFLRFEWAIPSVLTPYPGGHIQIGGVGIGSIPGGGQGVEDVDYGKIEQIVRTVIGTPADQSLVGLFGGDVRKGIYDKCKQAVGDAIRGPFDQWMRDRVYEVWNQNAPGYWQSIKDWAAGKYR